METRRIKVTLIDEMLGTNPRADIHEKFISSNAPDAETRAEELEHLPTDEMVKIKSACGFLRKVKGTKSEKIKAYKKIIDGLIKVYPDKSDSSGRYLTLHLPEGTEIGNCQRPLRAQTMQGERVALANSETVPAGTWFECDVCVWDDNLWDTVEEWLDYGEFNGLGQWRSSGKGSFKWEYVS